MIAARQPTHAPVGTPPAWRDARLGDVLEVLHGFAFKGEFIEKDGPLRLVTPGNFYEAGGFRDRGADQKSYSGPVPDRFVLAPGSLVVAMTEQAPGLLGSSGLIPNDGAGWLHNQRIGLVKHDEAFVDRRFIYYLFNAPTVRRQINATATGTKVRHTAPKRIGDITIRLPRFTVQRAIGAALGAFDDLITINERRIEVLERLAASIHREWFVDELPAGWSSESLFDVADVGFGFSFKSTGFGETGPNPVIRIRDVPRGFTSTFSEETPADRYRVDDGDVLIGMDGEFHMRQWADGSAWLNQRVARIRPKPGLSARHLLEALRTPIAELNDSIVGTTVAHLGKRHLEEIRMPLPPPDLLEPMTQAFDTISASQLTLTKQNRRLAATRDLLLPRLVTGLLDISEIDLGDLPEETAS